MHWIIFLMILVHDLVEGDSLYSKEYGKCTIEGVNATCVRIMDCPAALEAVRAKKEPPICFYHGLLPFVCCLNPKQEADTGRSSIREENLFEMNATHPCYAMRPKMRKTGNKALDKCSEYQQRLLYPCIDLSAYFFTPESDIWVVDDRCKAPDIYGVGGSDAQKDQFRHMALLLFGKEISLSMICGGSVLSERYILTAGHCSSHPQLGPVSTAVTGILKMSDPRENWRMNRIKRVIKYPKYNPPHKYHDIALLETVEEIKLDAKVVPICLHTGEHLPRPKVSATGWGLLGHRKPLADHLQDVTLRRNNKCRTVYGIHRLLRHGFDDRTQLCYGDDVKIRDTCEGDSGGPVQVRTARCRFSVIGVTSFGKGCGSLGVPAVYTRVAFYAPWIADIVWPDD